MTHASLLYADTHETGIVLSVGRVRALAQHEAAPGMGSLRAVDLRFPLRSLTLQVLLSLENAGR